MESKLIDDEIEITIINGIKALNFVINDPKKKVSYDPVFKKWLETQIRERGDNGI